MRRVAPTLGSGGRVVAFCLAFVVAGCASRATQNGPEAGPGNAESATVVVDNQSTAQMAVYAVAVGQRVRIGTVNGLNTETLEVPDYLVGGGRNLSFVTEPLAGRAAASTVEMYVSPGDNLRLVIPSTVR